MSEPYCCPICDNVCFATAQQLQGHMIAVHGSQPFCCHICTACFGTEEGLAAHMRDAHGPPNGVPHACMIAFLFGSTVLKGVFPILRMFRDKVMPKISVRIYYAVSGWCLKRAIKP